MTDQDAGLEWQIGVWDRISQLYWEEVDPRADRRFVVAVALHHFGSRVARHGLGSGASAIEAAARGALDAAIRSDESVEGYARGPERSGGPAV